MKSLSQATLVILTCVLALSSCSSCSSDPNKTINTQFGTTVNDSAQLFSPKTYSYLKNIVPPKGIVPVVVTVDRMDEERVGTYADDLFDEYCDKKYDGATFARRGVLVVVSRQPQLVQVRVGSTYSLYTRMKGATAGDKYLTYQEKIPERGLEETCVMMLENTIAEIEHCRSLSWFKQFFLKISVSHAAEFLGEMGTPSESFFNQIYFRPFLMLVSLLYGMCRSWVMAFVLMALLWQGLLSFVNARIEQLKKRHSRQENGEYDGKVYKGLEVLFDFLLGILNFIVIVPTLAAIAVLSTARMEDIIAMRANHIPFVDSIDWHSPYMVGAPTFGLVMLLFVVFYLRYVLKPQKFLTLASCRTQDFYYKNSPFERMLCDLLSRYGKKRGSLVLLMFAAAGTALSSVADNDSDDHLTTMDKETSPDASTAEARKGCGMLLSSLFFLSPDETDYSHRPFYLSWVNVHREALLFSVFVIIAAVVLLSRAFVTYFLAVWGISLLIRAFHEWRFYHSLISQGAHSSDFQIFSLVPENWKSYVATTLAVAAILLFCNPTPNTQTVEKVDTTLAIPQDIAGLYFVTEQGGEKVKGVTARLEKVDDVAYTLTVYSDMPTVLYYLEYDSDRGIFTGDQLGEGRVEYLGQTNHLTIKFVTGWTLQN